jgi:response regulator of citrate/malate metabolism
VDILCTSTNILRIEEMSTKERYGTAIYEALGEHTYQLADMYIQWATIGEVAKRAGVSRPTAKKYLDLLVEMGRVKSMKFGARTGYALEIGE